MERKLIKIFKTEQGWMADFQDDLSVYRAFGSYGLPTAFTAVASAATVLAAIRKLNPQCDVIAA